MNIVKTLLARSSALLLALPLAVAAAPEPVVERPARFSDAELDALLAPIALYPDTVLSHVLIAATYPQDVFDAADWTRSHPDLDGETAVRAVGNKPWDASVKALVAFPEILERMDDDRGWTEDLGDAFLSQEADVMDRVQVLRDHAYDSGHLGSLEHVRVVRERELIYLEPAVREIVYVPYYDPWIVYGAWWWPAYPPHRWSYWAGYPVHHYTLHSGFWWGLHFTAAPTFYYTAVHWPARRIVVVHHHHHARPIYSGRDVARHHRAEHWRGISERRDRGWQASSREVRRPRTGVDRPQQRAPRDAGRTHEPGPDRRAARDRHREAREDRRERREDAHERREDAHERREDRRERHEDARERREDRRESREDARERREDRVERREEGRHRSQEPREEGRTRRGPDREAYAPPRERRAAGFERHESRRDAGPGLGTRSERHDRPPATGQRRGMQREDARQRQEQRGRSGRDR